MRNQCDPGPFNLNRHNAPRAGSDKRFVLALRQALGLEALPNLDFAHLPTSTEEEDAIVTETA
jgi:hypothetical protein